MKTIRFFLVAVAVLMLSSCSLKASWDLVGKWQKVDGQETIEFLRDGTMKMVNGPTAFTTTYKVNDPQHVEISVGSLGEVVLQFTVAKEALTLTDSKGKATRYQKAK